MSVVQYSRRALKDIQRLTNFLLEQDPLQAAKTVDIITQAIEILQQHPEIGRKLASAALQRELVISRGRTGYIALYHYHPVLDRVVITAIRHQRESGYLAN